MVFFKLSKNNFGYDYKGKLLIEILSKIDWFDIIVN